MRPRSSVPTRHEERGSRVSHADGAARPDRAAGGAGGTGPGGGGGRAAADRPAGAGAHRRLGVGGGHPPAARRRGCPQHGGEPRRPRPTGHHLRLPGRPARRRHPARQVRRRRGARLRRERGRAGGAGRLRGAVRDPAGRRVQLPERRGRAERPRVRRIAGRRHRDGHPRRSGRCRRRLPLPDRPRRVRGQRPGRRRVLRLPHDAAARRPGDRIPLRADRDRGRPRHRDAARHRRRPPQRRPRAAGPDLRLQLPPAAVPAARPRRRRLADPRHPPRLLAQLPDRAHRRPVQRGRPVERHRQVHPRRGRLPARHPGHRADPDDPGRRRPRRRLAAAARLHPRHALQRRRQRPADRRHRQRPADGRDARRQGPVPVDEPHLHPRVHGLPAGLHRHPLALRHRPGHRPADLRDPGVPRQRDREEHRLGRHQRRHRSAPTSSSPASTRARRSCPSSRTTTRTSSRR